MALAPTSTEWQSIWPSNVDIELTLPELIELINRRFKNKTTPTQMATAGSRPIWNDISVRDTDLPKLIRLLNRRLGGVRIPMNEEAITVIGDAPVQTFVDENFIMNGRHDNTWWRGSQYGYQVLVSSGNTWSAALKRYARFISVNNSQRALWLRNFIEPRAYGDSRYGTPGRDMAWRIRECLALDVAAGFGVTASHDAMYEWGLAGGTNTAPITPSSGYRPFIGFQAILAWRVAAPSTVMNWRTVMTDPTGAAIIRTTNTGINGQGVARDMMIEIDEHSNTVNWYIDNALVDTYKPTSDSWPGESGAGNAPLGEWKLSYAGVAVSGATTAMTINMLMHMAPGTPSLSYTVNSLP